MCIGMNVGVVKSRAHCVLATASVHVHVDFLRGDRGRLGLDFVDLTFMSLGQVLVSRSIKVAGKSSELEALEVSARTWVGQVGRWLVTARTWGCGAESRNLVQHRSCSVALNLVYLPWSRTNLTSCL